MRRPLILAPLLLLGACAADRADAPNDAARPDAAPPTAVQAWMDRLNVPHHYDPETGFIVADETTPLPDVVAAGPPLDETIRASRALGRPVLAFATADRCAPCQQYKKDAINDPAVVRRLESGAFLVAHVEVDQRPDLAERYLGAPAIPMTYALVDGEVAATLRGQRSAADLLGFIDDHLAP